MGKMYKTGMHLLIYYLKKVLLVMKNGPAGVVQWSHHLGAMCSRARRTQCASGPEFKSKPWPGKARPPT